MGVKSAKLQSLSYLVCLVGIYHPIVFLNPSSNEVLALNPNSFSTLDVSNILLGCPSRFFSLSCLYGFFRFFRLSGLFGLFSLFG